MIKVYVRTHDWTCPLGTDGCPTALSGISPDIRYSGSRPQGAARRFPAARLLKIDSVTSGETEGHLESVLSSAQPGTVLNLNTCRITADAWVCSTNDDVAVRVGSPQ
jgi:hypothetical protein